jgi:hypothetical protein
MSLRNFAQRGLHIPSWAAPAFVLISLPMHAASLSVPFTVQATFPNFSIGPLSTSTWTISGAGTWLLDASTGINTQTANLVISFPGLNTNVPVSFTATGPFDFAREIATNRVGILAEGQGSVTVTLAGVGVVINLVGLSSMLPVTESTFPPFPTSPPSPLALPAAPPGFSFLVRGYVPPLTELGSAGTIMASGTAKVPLLPTQDFKGIGTIKFVPSNAACPAGNANPLTVFAGTWTFGMDGQNPLGTAFAAAGQFTAAVNTVNNTQTGIVAVTQSLSTPISSEMDSGTYQILPDCSGGSMTFNVFNQPRSFDFCFQCPQRAFLREHSARGRAKGIRPAVLRGKLEAMLAPYFTWPARTLES